MKKEHCFDDVFLIPQKCVVKSRSQCDITVELGNRKFRNPVIAANMKSVVDFDTCKYLANKGMFYIMHRFDLNIYDLLKFIMEMNYNKLFSSISIGIGENDKKIIDECSKVVDSVPHYITIDVAHAHSDYVADMVKFVKDKIPDTFVIVGNVATAEGVLFLEKSGADCVKLFIAPGSVCTTRVKTGFMRGTVECLKECAEVSNVPLIADGGIKEPGHIAKAIACGADMVMAGSFMAGFDENGGQIVLINGKKKYIYFGSASWSNKHHDQHIEGTDIVLDYKGSMENHIVDLECSLKSSVSYAGKRKITELFGIPMFTI